MLEAVWVIPDCVGHFHLEETSILCRRDKDGQRAWGNKLSLPAPNPNNHILKEMSLSAMERRAVHPSSAQSLPLISTRIAMSEPINLRLGYLGQHSPG